MRFLLAVPLLALLLAFASVEVPAGAFTPPWLEHAAVLPPPVVEVPQLHALEVPLASSPVVACSDAAQLHEVQAATAVRLGSEVPARRWFHHERGCVAF